MSDQSYLSLEKLTLAYGDSVAVADLDLSVRRGELIALLGPSGCGKTTTMRAIAGLLPVKSGKVILDGEDMTRTAPNKRAVGLVFQSYALFPHLSVYENVAFGLRLKGMKGAGLDAKVQSGIASVGLAKFADRKPAELSGGQQQRVALARSMVMEPKVLLLDEPLS
ncbi:MAG: ABC transporter ATP-binding protein, partial [Rhizobiaceae bacterium]